MGGCVERKIQRASVMREGRQAAVGHGCSDKHRRTGTKPWGLGKAQTQLPRL